MSKNTLRVISVIVLACLTFTSAAAQKIAFIDTAKVFQALPQREAALKRIQDALKDRKSELKGLKDEIEDKIDRLKRDSSLMSGSEVERLRIEIGQLDSTYKIKVTGLQEASSKKEEEEKSRLFGIIQDTAAKISKREGYDIVIDIQVVQYGNPAYDISDSVIEQLR